MGNAPVIKVQIKVIRPIQEVWSLWTDPMHVIKWNAPSADWHTTYATNDLRVGGSFLSRMEAKDNSMGFDFAGTYTRVENLSIIEYTIADGRKVKVKFTADKDGTLVTEEFEAETENTPELQQSGWQAILYSFQKYAETKKTELLRFDIIIVAKPELVYQRMLHEKYYKQWTSIFNPSSEYVGSWDKGSMIRFIGVDEKGNRGGMVSRIRENIPAKFVSIEHLGIIEGTKEIMSGPKIEDWKGALENYVFMTHGVQTKLEVCLESNEEFKAYFSESWPKALVAIKKLCEN